MHPRNTVKLNTSCGLLYRIFLNWISYKWRRRRKFDITSLILGFSRLLFWVSWPWVRHRNNFILLWMCMYVCNARVIYSKYMYSTLSSNISFYVCHIYIYIYIHTHTHTHTHCIVGYYSPNIIRVVTERKMRWARNVARMDENRNACRILVGKLVIKGSLGSLRHR